MAVQPSSKTHAIVQALLSRGPLREDEFHAIFAGITGKNPATHQQFLKEVIGSINNKLSYVHFELRVCRNQYDGRVYYGVVNNAPNEEAKLGTKYSIPQIAFYRAVLEAIALDAANQGFISSIVALNIRLVDQVQMTQNSQNSQYRVPHALKNFSLSQKERTLQDLIKDQWLSHTTNGKIGLGVRSFLDLRYWFRSNGAPSCGVCDEAGVKAFACPNEDCTVRMHTYCFKQKFSQRKIAIVCPSCGIAWPLAASEVQEVGEANVPQQKWAPCNDAASQSQKQSRRCKTEPAVAVPLNDAALRKSTRSCKRARSFKVEAVDAAEAQTRTAAPWGPVPKKARSCKV